MQNDDVEQLDAVLDRVRECGQALPQVALALSSWVADYLDLLVADLDRQINAGDGLVDTMVQRCPSHQ